LEKFEKLAKIVMEMKTDDEDEEKMNELLKTMIEITNVKNHRDNRPKDQFKEDDIYKKLEHDELDLVHPIADSRDGDPIFTYDD
jgi:hypothetical protein